MVLKFEISSTSSELLVKANIILISSLVEQQQTRDTTSDNRKAAEAEQNIVVPRIQSIYGETFMLLLMSSSHLSSVNVSN